MIDANAEIQMELHKKIARLERCYGAASDEAERLEAENTRLKEALTRLLKNTDTPRWVAIIEAENTRLREALGQCLTNHNAIAFRMDKGASHPRLREINRVVSEALTPQP